MKILKATMRGHTIAELAPFPAEKSDPTFYLEGTDITEEKFSEVLPTFAKAPEMLAMLDETMEDLNTIVDHASTWTPEQIRNHCFWMQRKLDKLKNK